MMGGAAASSTAPGNTSPSGEVRDLIAAALVMIVASLPVFLVGTLAVELRGFLHFSSTSLGFAIAFYYLGAAAASVPLGRLTDRVGAIRVMRAIAMAETVLLLILATLIRSWGGLGAVLVVSGMMSAGISSSTNQFLARRLRLDSQGFALGVKQAAVPFATLLGGLAVPAVALTIGWRWAFALAALLALGAALLIPAPPTTLAVRREHHRANADRPVVVRPLVVLALGLGLGVFAATSLTAFLVTAGVTIGLSQSAVGLTAVLASAGAVTARVGLGYLADRRDQCNFCVVAIMLACGASGYMLIAIGTAIRSEWLFIAGAVVGLGIGWGWNGLFNFAVVRTHMHAPARATAVAQVGGRLGGVIGPFAFGIVADRTCYTVAWVLTSCTGLAAAGAVMVGRNLLRAGQSQNI